MWRKRRKFREEELDRLEEALRQSKPGSVVHEDLLNQLKAFKEIEGLEKTGKTTFLGIKRDTWFAGVIGVIQIGLLAKLQDKFVMPKNLFSFLSIFKTKN